MPSILKKLLLISIFGLSIGVLAGLFWQATNRAPASPKRPKPWADSLSGKMNQSMTVVITPIDGVPDHDDQELHLRAEVTLNQPIDGEIQYQWTLPAEAVVVSGEIEDSWVGLKSKQKATAEITITNVSREGLSKTIFFHATGNISGGKLGGVGAFGINDTSFVPSTEKNSEVSSTNSDRPELSDDSVSKKPELKEKSNRIHQ